MKIFLATALALLLASPNAIACRCQKPRTPEEVKYFTHIFEGEVLKVTTPTGFGTSTHEVTFKVLQLLDGPHEDTITVFFGISACEDQVPDFLPGQRFLVSDNTAYRSKDNAGVTDPKDFRPSELYYGNYCSLLEPLSGETINSGI